MANKIRGSAQVEKNLEVGEILGVGDSARVNRILEVGQYARVGDTLEVGSRIAAGDLIISNKIGVVGEEFIAQKQALVGEDLRLPAHTTVEGYTDKVVYVDPLNAVVRTGKLYDPSLQNMWPNGDREQGTSWPYLSNFVENGSESSPSVDSVIQLSGSADYTSANIFADQDIRWPVNGYAEDLEYNFSVEARVSQWTGTGNIRFYMGFNFYDVDGNQCSYITSQFFEKSVTELAAPLANGDTTIQVTDASGWLTGTSRLPVIAEYEDSHGNKYDEYGYSRIFTSGCSVTSVDTTTNTITLSSPWNAGDYPVGTKIRCCASTGGTYRYIAWAGENISTDGQWETRTDVLRTSTAVDMPYRFDGKAILAGAAYMVPIMLVRPSTPGDWTVQLGRISLTPVKPEKQQYGLKHHGDSVRMTMNTSRSWYYNGSKIYGESLYSRETGGTGTNPVPGYSHVGTAVQKGDILSQMDIRLAVYADSLSYWRDADDIEIVLMYRAPADGITWTNTNILSNTQMYSEIITRDTVATPSNNIWTNNDPAFKISDMFTIRRVMKNINFSVPKAGWLTIYARPTNVPSTTGYYLMYYTYTMKYPTNGPLAP